MTKQFIFSTLALSLAVAACGTDEMEAMDNPSTGNKDPMAASTSGATNKPEPDDAGTGPGTPAPAPATNTGSADAAHPQATDPGESAATDPAADAAKTPDPSQDPAPTDAPKTPDAAETPDAPETPDTPSVPVEPAPPPPTPTPEPPTHWDGFDMLLTMVNSNAPAFTAAVQSVSPTPTGEMLHGPVTALYDTLYGCSTGILSVLQRRGPGQFEIDPNSPEGAGLNVELLDAGCDQQPDPTADLHGVMADLLIDNEETYVTGFGAQALDCAAQVVVFQFDEIAFAPAGDAVDVLPGTPGYFMNGCAAIVVP